MTVTSRWIWELKGSTNSPYTATYPGKQTTEASPCRHAGGEKWITAIPAIIPWGVATRARSQLCLFPALRGGRRFQVSGSNGSL